MSEPWRPLRAVLGGLVDLPDTFVVQDITEDSRQVSVGSAFLARAGGRRHGVEFARDAVAAGATAVIWEPSEGVKAPALGPDVLVIAVPKLGQQIGLIADRFFGAPSAALRVVGITGTNGKTTCAWLLSQALRRLGQPCGYMGTIGVRGPGDDDGLQVATHTTPDAITIHRTLAQMRNEGARAVAMEVSSHALDQDRVSGVRFHAAALTNLTRDHLDYHADMAAYAGAKQRLLDWPTLQARVINADDPVGGAWAEQRALVNSGAALLVTSAAGAVAPAGVAHVVARAVTATSSGLEIELDTHLGRARLSSPLHGAFNVENLLTVLGLLLVMDVTLADAVRALAQCQAPPGRMQSAGGGRQPLVLVDYAHTPDALAKVLQAARTYCGGELWCVFGCGGERDAGKRADMGAVAARLADRLLITDDNPRGEDPQAIAAAILRGAQSERPSVRATVEHQRETAIRHAIASATRRDVVVVAGKGHEDYQIIGTTRRPFNDLEVVRAVLAERGAA